MRFTPMLCSQHDGWESKGCMGQLWPAGLSRETKTANTAMHRGGLGARRQSGGGGVMHGGSDLQTAQEGLREGAARGR